MNIPSTIPEWREYPIQEELLKKIKGKTCQIIDGFAVDPEKVKKTKIINALKIGNCTRVYYYVWYDLTKEPFESSGIIN